MSMPPPVNFGPMAFESDPQQFYRAAVAQIVQSNPVLALNPQFNPVSTTNTTASIGTTNLDEASLTQAVGQLAQLVVTLFAGDNTPAEPAPIATGTATQSAVDVNAEDNPQEQAALADSLAAVASDPEGAILLEEAARRGVKITVGQPSDDPGVLGIARTDGDGNTEIVIGDGANIKTLVHELVHAVSTEDGNSKHEEGIADIIGYRVAERILENNNTPAAAAFRSFLDRSPGVNLTDFNRTDAEIHNLKIQVDGYANLDENNGIENTLATLGLNAFENEGDRQGSLTGLQTLV